MSLSSLQHRVWKQILWRISGARIRYSLAVVLVIWLGAIQHAYAVNTWNPTLLVNTQPYQVIDDTSALDLSLKFGNVLNKSLTYERTPGRFKFDAGLYVQGSLGVSGTMSGNALFVQRAFSGAGLVNCSNRTGEKLLWSGATQQFFCGSDQTGGGGLDYATVVGSFVNTSGDTMTGSLIVANGGTLAASGSIRTETNLAINEDSGAADAIVTFGSDGTNETATFKNNEDRFELSDDLHVTGSLYATGGLIIGSIGLVKDNLTLNSDNGAADAVLTFGNDSTAETLSFLRTTSRFEFSDDVRVGSDLTASGTLSVEGAAAFGSTLRANGVTYTFPTSDGSASGKVLKTSGAGVLSWSTDSTGAGGGISYAEASSWFVDQKGDSMTGSLTIANAGTLAASGSIRTEGDLTINQDNGASDAVLTFGNDTLAETASFLRTTSRFEFSDDLRVTNDLTASGTLSIEGAAAFGSTVRMNNVTYTWPTSTAAVSGAMLAVNPSNGQMSWTGPLITRINGNSGAAGPYMTWQNLTSNSADCTTTALCTAIMTTTGVGVGTWKFKYTLNYQTAATTTGIGIAINHTGTATTPGIIWKHLTSGGAAATGIADDVAGTAAGQLIEGKNGRTLNATIGSLTIGVITANANNAAIVEGIVVVTATGNLELKIASEVASSAVRIMDDSILELIKVQ